VARGLARVARVACSVARSVVRVAFLWLGVCVWLELNPSIVIERLTVRVVFPCACGFFDVVRVAFLAFFEFIF